MAALQTPGGAPPVRTREGEPLTTSSTTTAGPALDPGRRRRTQAERRAVTRGALLDATLEVLVEVGYARLTTTQVVARAGVTRGAQAHYFATKADLVVQALSHLTDRLVAEMVRQPLRNVDGHVEQYEALLNRLWEIYAGPASVALLELFVASRTDAELREHLIQFESAVARTLQRTAPPSPPSLVGRPDFKPLMVTASPRCAACGCCARWPASGRSGGSGRRRAPSWSPGSRPAPRRTSDRGRAALACTPARERGDKPPRPGLRSGRCPTGPHRADGAPRPDRTSPDAPADQPRQTSPDRPAPDRPATTDQSARKDQHVTATAPEVDASSIDLSDPEFWAKPMEERLAAFAALRAARPLGFFAEPEAPFIQAGPGYTALVRHADLVHVSSHPDLFCSGEGAVSIADLPEELREFYGSLISMDDPRHAKIRRIVSKAFTPKMLDALLDDVAVITDEVLAAARAAAEAGDGTFDLVEHISAPLPLQVICRMMGISEEDRGVVLEKTNIILSGGDPELITDANEALGMFLEAGGTLAALMEKLAAERQERPTGDLTSALVRTEVDGETLTFQEIASFFILLCVAGNETTRTAITHGVHLLSQFPDQKERWLADPSLTRTAVEEIVRMASPVMWMRRTATQQVEVGGQHLRQGRQVPAVLRRGEPGRDRVRGPGPLRRRPRPQPARRLRRRRPALLPRRPPGPSRDHGRVPEALRADARPRGGRRARPAALVVRQRHQAAARAAHRRVAPGAAVSPVVDRSLCASTGMCEMVAPDLFEIDDDGELVVLVQELPDDRVEQARAAARACPTRALSVA